MPSYSFYRFYSLYSLYSCYSCYKKNEGANLAIDSLLGGGYLRLPMSLTIVVVTLRALCQEWKEVGLSRYNLL